MNRHNSNRPLPLWLSLLVIPVLANALYLHFINAAAPNRPEVIDSPPIAAVESVRAAAQKGKVQGASADLARPSTFQSQPATTPAATPQAADEAIESARAAVHKVENGVYDRATALFEREPIDVDWATGYEQSLRAMFAGHHGLQRVSVNSISCHTSMCRIEVFTPRDADADFFTAMFYDALDNFQAGAFKTEAAITRRMEQGMTSVYVARKDHTLGFY